MYWSNHLHHLVSKWLVGLLKGVLVLYHIRRAQHFSVSGTLDICHQEGQIRLVEWREKYCCVLCILAI